MGHIIEVQNLKKSYGSVRAVEDMSFYVEKGKLFAFLGPNGAGKSTTINCICTFLQPDGGTVTVDGFTLGKDDDRIRERIGIVFQESLMDEGLTVEENLKLRGRLYHMSKAECEIALKRVAKITEIAGIMKRAYGKLSGGQKRRVDIARALLHTPKILFLDEPTTGLDAQTRKSVWDTIKKLQAEQGMTVFLTTHYLEEAEDADYCIVVDDGKIADKGNPFELKERYVKDKLSLKCRQEEAVIRILQEKGYQAEKKGVLIEVPLSNVLEALPLLRELEAEIMDFTVVKGTMDDVFIEITGKELRE